MLLNKGVIPHSPQEASLLSSPSSTSTSSLPLSLSNPVSSANGFSSSSTALNGHTPSSSSSPSLTVTNTDGEKEENSNNSNNSSFASLPSFANDDEGDGGGKEVLCLVDGPQNVYFCYFLFGVCAYTIQKTKLLRVYCCNE